MKIYANFWSIIAATFWFLIFANIFMLVTYSKALSLNLKIKAKNISDTWKLCIANFLVNNWTFANFCYHAFVDKIVAQAKKSIYISLEEHLTINFTIQKFKTCQNGWKFFGVKFCITQNIAYTFFWELSTNSFECWVLW